MDAIPQAKHTARVLISEARARRLAGHGFWCMFRMAQSARRRAATLPPPGAAGPPHPTGALRMTQQQTSRPKNGLAAAPAPRSSLSTQVELRETYFHCRASSLNRFEQLSRHRSKAEIQCARMIGRSGKSDVGARHRFQEPVPRVYSVGHIFHGPVQAVVFVSGGYGRNNDAEALAFSKPSWNRPGPGLLKNHASKMVSIAHRDFQVKQRFIKFFHITTDNQLLLNSFDVPRHKDSGNCGSSNPTSKSSDGFPADITCARILKTNDACGEIDHGHESTVEREHCALSHGNGHTGGELRKHSMCASAT